MAKKEYLMAMVTVCLWSTLSAIDKMLVNKLSVTMVMFGTSLVALLVLSMVNLCPGRRKIVKSYRPRNYVKMAFLGFLGFFCYNYFYCTALTYMSSQEACIVNYMWPMLTVVMSCIILKEPFTVRKCLAALLSVVGMVVIVTQGDVSNIKLSSLKGVVLCLSAALCYAIYSAYNKKEQYDQLIILNMSYLVMAGLSGIMALLSHGFTPLGKEQVAGFLWMGAVVGTLAYGLWGMAINSGDTAKIAILAYLCPFLSLVVSYFLLGERISPYSFVGLILIIGGVLIQIREKEA